MVYADFICYYFYNKKFDLRIFIEIFKDFTSKKALAYLVNNFLIQNLKQYVKLMTQCKFGAILTNGLADQVM